jgi:hypothetical protein
MKKILAVVVVLCVVFGVAVAGPPRLESQAQFQKFVIGSQHNDQTGVLSVTDVSWKEGTALSATTAVNFNESTLISEKLTTMNIAKTTVTDQCISENQKEAAIKSREIVSGYCQLQQMQNSSSLGIAEVNPDILSVQTGLTRLQNKADPFKPNFHFAEKSPPAVKVLLC